jgi:hypothetical protein
MDKGHVVSNPQGNRDRVTNPQGNRYVVYKTLLMNNTLKEFCICQYPLGNFLKTLEPRWDLRLHDICIRYSKIPDNFTAV